MTFDPEKHLDCGCRSCAASGEAILLAISHLMEGEHCSHSILEGAMRTIADTAAILVKPGREAIVRDYLVALFAARFDRAVIRNAQVEQRERISQ